MGGFVFRLLAMAWLFFLPVSPLHAAEKSLAYIVSDLRIPFWNTMQRGIVSRAEQLGYSVTVLSSENDAKKELQHTARAIREKVDGLIVSPTNSSAAVTILKLAQDAGIPVVLADIGTDGGEYVSYIASDNHEGAYRIGQVLVHAMKEKGWQQGTVGIIAIPQRRANGKARTEGFMKAMKEAGIKTAGMRQQVNFSYQETYDYTRNLIEANPHMRAIWLQGSDRYQAAFDGIKAMGRQDRMLLVCFDAEPEFLQMIPRKTIVGAAMQQPFLMGEKAVVAMDDHLNRRPVKKLQLQPVLPVSSGTLQEMLPVIRRNVFGILPP